MGRKLSDAEAFEQALKKAKRHEDGSADEADIAKLMRALIIVDVETEKTRRIKAAIDRETKEGFTEPDGQLSLAGMEIEPAEPRRMIRGNNNGRICENSVATYPFREADCLRSEENTEKAMRSSRGKRKYLDVFANWIQKQLQSGRPFEELTWWNCVHETGIWTPLADDNSKAAD